jgi:hypothetical protein
MNENNDNTVRTNNTGADTDVASAYLEQSRFPEVRNADNEWLGSFSGPGFRIGYLDDVNGPGAAEVVGFVPTRHELLELAKYWTNVAVDIEYDWFLYGQVGSSDMRRRPFARRRIGRIQELLGDAVDKVVGEVYEEYGKKQDPRSWEVFLHGTEEQRKAFKEEIDRAFREQDENANNQE